MRWLVIFLFSTLSCVKAQLPTHVVKLTRSDFESRTQAATGQTTGRWCVLFTGENDKTQAQGAWDSLAADEEKKVIFAQVTGEPSLSRRFGIEEVPTVLLFAKRQVYRYPQPLSGTSEDIGEAITTFLESLDEVEGQPVPGEPSAVEDFIKEHHSMLKYGAGIIIFLLLNVGRARRNAAGPRADHVD